MSLYLMKKILKLRISENDEILRLVHHQGVKNQVLNPEDLLSDHNHQGAQDQKDLQGLQDHPEICVQEVLDDLIDVSELQNAWLVYVQEVLNDPKDDPEVMIGHLIDVQEVRIDLKDDPEVLVDHLTDVQEVLEDLTDAQGVIHAHLLADNHLIDVSDLHLPKGQDMKFKAQRMTFNKI